MNSSLPEVTLSLALSSPRPLAAADESLLPEERGIRLIQLLLTCAKHASSGDIHRADDCLCQISPLASVTGDSMQRLAARFASALAVRLVKRWRGLYKALNHDQSPPQELDRAWTLFGRAFPFLGLAYSIIGKTLLQSMTEERMIHIVDLGSGDPKLWVSILQGFSGFPDGPPHLKITCVNDNELVLDKLGSRLVKEAEALDIPLQFSALPISLRELTVEKMKLRSGEALAFVSILSLHVLLAEDDRVDAHFGADGKSNSIRYCKQMSQFLSMIRSVSPKLVFLVEKEVDHNHNRLVDRFVQGLHYYSAVFDSIDAAFGTGTSTREERFVLEEMFGKEIENIVACEGLEREERHERYARWIVRFAWAGFRPVQMWYDPTEDAKQMAEAAGGGRDGYKVVNQRASWMICWHDRPLFAVSAWTC